MKRDKQRPQAMPQAMPLAERIRRLILAGGPIALPRFMEMALLDPDGGYYSRGEGIGPSGDFVTAPEVSQMFGEIVGSWLRALWHELNCPAPIHIVELGPGTGRLMNDICRVLRLDAGLMKAMDLHLVEASSQLRRRQENMLKHLPFKFHWHNEFSSLPPGPILLIANEFFDALPIHQFVLIDNIWHERVVGLSKTGALEFGLSPPLMPAQGQGLKVDFAYLAALAGKTGSEKQSPFGRIYEYCDHTNRLAGELAKRISHEGGGALIIDYGYYGPAFGDTFQAIRQHKPVDPLQEPGFCDLTAHVDFAQIAAGCRDRQAQFFGPLDQGEFLLRCGLDQRAAQLSQDKDDKTAGLIKRQRDRLCAFDKMGQLFKVAAICPPGLTPPAFEAVNS